MELLMSRYGSLHLHADESDPQLVTLTADRASVLDELDDSQKLKELGLRRTGELHSHCPKMNRGLLKQEMTRLGYPVLDYAGYRDGQKLKIAWRETLGEMGEESSAGFRLRDYQRRLSASSREPADMAAAVWSCCPAGQAKQLSALRCWSSCSARH